MASISRFPKYEFMSNGDIVSYTRKKPFVMSPIRAGNYLAVQLSLADGGGERNYVHALVCEAFKGPRPQGAQCRHLDGNKYNNAAENLAWGTASENNADKIAHGTTLHGEKNPMAVLTSSQVTEMRRDREKTKTSYANLGRKFNVSTMTAYRAVTGQSWSKL